MRAERSQGGASEIPVPGTTGSACSRPVHALTGDNVRTGEEEAELPPPTDLEPAAATESKLASTEAADPILSTAVHPAPTTEEDPPTVPGDSPMAINEEPTVRPGSAPPPSDSELTQLSDADAS